jgi:hypothetical protein
MANGFYRRASLPGYYPKQSGIYSGSEMKKMKKMKEMKEIKRIKRMKEMKKMVPMHNPSRMGRHIINRMLQLTEMKEMKGMDSAVRRSVLHPSSFHSQFSILNLLAVWLCLRRENTRGEKGPWSEVISAIVP